MSEVRCCICGKALERASAIHSERTDNWFCPVNKWQACENRALKRKDRAAA